MTGKGKNNSWRAKTGKYLFNGRALAKVFRGKFLRAMTEAGYTVPTGKKPWIAQVKAVGNGEEAIGYLSRYLYRGVIADRQIIDSDSQNVTFQYQNSQTKKTERKTEGVIDFLWKVLRHTLPKGFRRARDYVFFARQCQGAEGKDPDEPETHTTAKASRTKGPTLLPELRSSDADPPAVLPSAAAPHADDELKDKRSGITHTDRKEGPKRQEATQK